MKTYHVGIHASGTTAVFQYRRCIDFLSCEILEYLGERATTKAAVKARLKEGYAGILKELNDKHPGRNFTRIVID